MAQGIVQVTRTDVSPTADGSFYDVDVTAYVAAGAEGIILEIVNTAGTEYGYDVKKKGSTDDYYSAGNGIEDTGWTIRAVGIDGDDIFEAAIENAAVEIYLVGYVPDGCGEFLTNVSAHATDPYREFVDIDISGETAATAKIAFFFLVGSTLSFRYQIREEGSTDDRYTDRDIYSSDVRGLVMSLDSNEVCEHKGEAIALTAFLVGWIFDDYAVSWANAKAAATETTGSYVETELADIASGSNGAFFFIGNAGDGGEYACGIRNADLDHDNYYDFSEFQYGYVAVNSSKNIDQKLEHTNQNLFYFAYVTEPAVAGLSIPVAMHHYKLMRS